MHALMRRLFPICRSITGNGVRETLSILRETVPLEVHEVPSGTKAFDWTVPDEWNIRDAFVIGPSGEKVIDFRRNNLHVVGYSEPINQEMDLKELTAHLHTLPEQPDAIPYRTSYYDRSWGFCMRHSDFLNLAPGRYRVVIDSSLRPGSLTYGELKIPGKSEKEILLSTNICHPSMANNELSGPVLTTFLARWLLEKPCRRFSYRILWLPETIGAITYLGKHGEAMKANTVAGYQIVCVGGPDVPTYLMSRRGNTVTDRITNRVLKNADHPFKVHAYAKRASDERQFGSPGIDLPVGSLMRSKYHDYPEYHTSLDNLDFVRPEHMEASYDLYRECLDALEQRRVFVSTGKGGEPNLGKRGLYPKVGGTSHTDLPIRDLLAVLAYADGEHDLNDIADIHDVDVSVLARAAAVLTDAGLLKEVE